MSDHNRAIRMAQNLLRKQADGFKDTEIGYQQYAEHPSKRAYNRAAEALEVLIIPEENITRPTHLGGTARFTDPVQSLTTASGPMERGSVTLEIPAALYEQVSQNEPGFSKWGVRVSVNEDRSSRIEFPESTEQRYFQSEAGRVVQLTLREPNFPVDRVRTWSFNADYIVERSQGRQS